MEPGFAFKSKEFTDFGIPVLKIKNVKANSVPLHSLSYVDESFLASRPTKIAKKGDLLITMSGNRHDGTKETWVGKVAEFRHDGSYFLNQRVGALRLKLDVAADTRCCGYFLSSDLYQNRFIAVATSSGGQANLSPEQILNETISLPTLRSQQSISSLLGALDDKIENNRRMNETLEEMARAIFKSWFVDFDPVHAKAAGNAPAHMDADTAALFPSSFGDGGLPVGWLELPLSDVTTRITKGTTPTKGDMALASNEVAQVNFLKVNMVSSEGVILKDKLETIPNSIHLSKLKRSILKKDDVLYSIAGTIGRVVSVSDEILPANTNQALAIISPNTNIVPAGFIRLTMSRPDIQSSLNSSVVQGVQANLGLGVISNQVAVFPPADQIFSIFEKIRLLLEKKQMNQLENEALTELRDTLLPKLMSGEIRVTDAKSEVEAAV